MKNLQQYVYENEELIIPTNEWMVEHYTQFNGMYFNNELPDASKVELLVKEMPNSNWLGCQGFNRNWYVDSQNLENGMYVMYYRSFGTVGISSGRRWKYYDQVDKSSRVTDITILRPHIWLSSARKFTQTQMEDTMIHEMVHLYLHLGGYSPKQAHGKEFRRECTRIRNLAKEKYNKEYQLMRLASGNGYAYTDDVQAQLEKSIEDNIKKLGGVMTIVYRIQTEPNTYEGRMIFTRMRKFNKVYADVNKLSSRLSEFKVSETAYEILCKKFGKLKVFDTANRWYYTRKIEDALNEINDWQTNIGEGMKSLMDIINENKFDFERNARKNLKLEIQPYLNLSEINLEDLINGYLEREHEELEEGGMTPEELDDKAYKLVKIKPET